jgi:hypothetical protein
MKTSRCSFLLLGVLVLLGNVQAATITWSTGPSFMGPNGFDARSTQGIFVSGFNYGANQNEVIGGDTWVPTLFGSQAFATDVNALTSNAGFNAMLADAGTSGLGSETLTLTGLTIGNEYLFQVFVGDARPCCNTRTQTFSPSTPQELIISHGAFNVVNGSFVADATTQNWVITGSNALILNGAQLRDVTASGSPVPEPATTALFGAGLLLLLLRRR